MRGHVRVALVLLAACSSSKGDHALPAPEPRPAVTADGPGIPEGVASRLAPGVAAELARTWESSGTRARLKSVGLDASSASPTRTDLGGAAAFAVSRAAAPPLAADVHFFTSSAALDAAAARVADAPYARNGAFLVLVTASDPASAARVIAAVSGEE